MKKINSENIMNRLMSIVARFPVSTILIIILALWKFSLGDYWYESSPLETVLITGILLATASQLLYEQFFRHKTKITIRLLLYAGVIFLLFFYHYYFSMSLNQIDGPWTLYSIPGIRAMIVYFLLVLLLVWIPSMKSRIKFSDSFLVLFKGFFTSLFFAFILFVGMNVTFLLFQFLFFSLDFNWFSFTYISTFIFLLPTIFLTFIPDYQETESTDKNLKSLEDAVNMPTFLRGLLSYALIPVMGIYTVLLVLYILTNLTSGFFRENLLEALILTYAVNGWILLILSDSIENTIARVFKRSFPFLLMFILVFQILATFMEIQNVGVTHGRYLNILFSISSILSALWYVFKESRLKLLPIVSFVAGIIALIPPIDAVGVSVNSQVSRVENLLVKNDILTEEKEIIPQSEVSIVDQNNIKESIRYLQGINALNQIEWFPKDESYNMDALFGFDEIEEEIVEEPIEEPVQEPEEVEETEEEPIENDTYKIDLVWGEQYSLDLDEYNYMVNLVLENNETTSEVVFVGDDYHVLEISTENGLTITSEINLEDVVFDFSYIFDSFDKEDASLPLDQMTFVEEKAGLTLTVFVESLIVDQENYTIEFILFM